MPNIPVFESNEAVRGLQPQNSGYEAFIQEGRHIEATYRAIGESTRQLGQDIGGTIKTVGDLYGEHVARQELQTGLANQAQTSENLTQSWNQTVAADAAAPTHDPHLFDKWKAEVLQPTLDAQDSSFSQKQSKNWWMEQKGRLLQHYTERGIVDMASLSGHQALLDTKRSIDSATSHTYLDPTSADLNRGTIDQVIDAHIQGLGANASPEAIEQLNSLRDQAKGAITLAQGKATIENAKDPVAAAQAFVKTNEASTYLDGQQLEGLSKYGEETNRVNQEKIKSANVAAKQQAELEAHGVASRIRSSMYDDNGVPHIDQNTVEAVRQFNEKYGDVAGPEGRELWTAITEIRDRQATNKDVQSNPTIQQELYDKMAAGTLTAADVDANVRSLSNFDYSRLHSGIAHVQSDPMFKQMNEDLNGFLKSERARILGPSIPGFGVSPARQAQYYEFERNTRFAVDAMIKSGAPPQQVRDTLLNPADAKNFLGAPQHMQFYLGNPNKTTARTAAAPAGPARPAHNPGESMDAYLARVGVH